MIGCPLSWKCILACRCGEESQQPTCPQVRHRRKCTHLEPILRQSSQPSALGVTSRIIFRCGSTILSPSLPVRRSADRLAPRSGAISHLCGAQLILDRQLADLLHVATIDPDLVEQSGQCYHAVSHWPRLGDFRCGSHQRTLCRLVRAGLYVSDVFLGAAPYGKCSPLFNIILRA